MSDMSIKSKLIIGFCSVLVIFGLSGSVAYSQFQSLMKNNHWSSHTYEVIISSENILASLVNMETGMRGFLLSGQEHFLDPFKIGSEKYHQHFKKLKNLTSDNNHQQKRLRDLDSQFNAWKSEFTSQMISLRRQVETGDNTFDQLVHEVRKARGKTYMDGMRKTLNDIRTEEEKLLAVLATEVKSSEITTNQAFIFGSLLALITGILISFLLSRNIIKTLGGEPSYAKTISSAVAEGNLMINIALNNGDDSSLLYSLKSMKEELATVINHLKNSASNLFSRSESLSTSASETSQSTTAQSASTASMAASIEQLSVSIASVSDNTRDVLSYSEALNIESREGEVIVGKTLEEMEKINRQVKDTADVVTEMSENSAQISKIIEVIREITEQTNLLALNAAIEAARAGEMGRGFSVVADEVRKLAEKTSESANEIAEISSKVQSTTNTAVQKMDSVVETVATGEDLTKQSGSKISIIQQKVIELTASINQISLALEEQTQASNNISESVENIAQMTEENSSATNATSKTADELSKMSAELNNICNRFKTA